MCVNELEVYKKTSEFKEICLKIHHTESTIPGPANRRFAYAIFVY